IAFFNRLNQFYLTFAEKNKDHEISPEQWKEYGESVEFFILNRPMPDFHPPELGNIKLTDQKFQRLLEKLRVGDRRDEAELASAARGYVITGAEGTERFLNQTRAALLDKQNQGGWPYRSSLIHPVESRQVMLN